MPNSIVDSVESILRPFEEWKKTVGLLSQLALGLLPAILLHGYVQTEYGIVPDLNVLVRSRLFCVATCAYASFAISSIASSRYGTIRDASAKVPSALAGRFTTFGWTGDERMTSQPARPSTRLACLKLVSLLGLTITACLSLWVAWIVAPVQTPRAATVQCLEFPHFSEDRLLQAISALNRTQSLIHVEYAARSFNRATLTQSELRRLRRGRDVDPEFEIELARLLSNKQTFIGITHEKLAGGVYAISRPPVSVISTFGLKWQPELSPEEIIAYFIVVTAISLQVAESNGWDLSSLLAERGTVDGQALTRIPAGKTGLVGLVRSGYLSRELQLSILDHLGVAYWAACQKLVGMDWLRKALSKKGYESSEKKQD